MERVSSSSSVHNTPTSIDGSVKRPREEEGEKERPQERFFAGDGSATNSVVQVRKSPSSPLVKIPYKGPPSSAGSSLKSSLKSSPLVISGAKVAPFPASPMTSSPLTRLQQRNEKWAILLQEILLKDTTREAAHVLKTCGTIVAALPADGEEAKDILLTLCAALRDPENTLLRAKIVSGEMPPEVLVTLEERELMNPRRRRELDEEFQKRAKDTNLLEIENAQKTTSTLFVCPRCKARDCSFMEKQTRSGDEPMTVFCTCNKCGNKWKR